MRRLSLGLFLVLVLFMQFLFIFFFFHLYISIGVHIPKLGKRDWEWHACNINSQFELQFDFPEIIQTFMKCKTEEIMTKTLLQLFRRDHLMSKLCTVNLNGSINDIMPQPSY